MKKGLFPFFIFMLLTTSVWADISQKQVEKYLQVSGIDVVLEKMKKQTTSIIVKEGEKRGIKLSSENLTALTAILSKKENLEKFVTPFKFLNEKDYEKILKFYNTKVGKKMATLARAVDISDDNGMEKKFLKKELSAQREVLITKLLKLFISEKKIRIETKATLQPYLNTLSEKISKKELDTYVNRIIKNSKMSIAYDYKDYTNDELNTLINYYQTTASKMEQKALKKGKSDYLKAVKSQIVKIIKRKKSSV